MHILDRRNAPVAWVGFLGILVSSTLGQQPDTAVAQIQGEQAQAAAAREVRGIAQGILDEGAPGVQICVGVDGVVILSLALGLADIEQGLPLRTTSRIRVGSVAKAFTGSALVQLVSEEILDLDEPIQRYVPEFPEFETGAISCAHLASHQSGIRHYQGWEFMRAAPTPDLATALGIFKDSPLKHAPGADFTYSTYGYTLLSAAMESAAGQPYLELMNVRVFRPLGMDATVADYADRVLPGRATPYARFGSGFLPARPVDNSHKWAGGGFLSTAEDLARYGMAHMKPGFLTQEQLALLQTPRRTDTGQDTRYGLGWRSRRTPQGVLVLGHSGGSMGGGSLLGVVPSHGLVVALACNVSGAPIGTDRMDEVLALFLVD